MSCCIWFSSLNATFSRDEVPPAAGLGSPRSGAVGGPDHSALFPGRTWKHTARRPTVSWTQFSTRKLFGNMCKTPSLCGFFFFPRCPSILGELLPVRGRYYWETIVTGSAAYRLGVVYSTANRDSPLGENSLSWCLQCIPSPSGYAYPSLPSPFLKKRHFPSLFLVLTFHLWSLRLYSCTYQLLHNDVQSSVFVIEMPERVGTLLDYQLGRLSFYNAHSGQLLGTFSQRFTHQCHPALALETPGSLEVSMVLEAPEFTRDS